MFAIGINIVIAAILIYIGIALAADHIVKAIDRLIMAQDHIRNL